MTAPELPAAHARLLERFEAGQRVALARAISWVESQRPGFEGFLNAALSKPPQARRVGFTGPPGAGKSSLVARVAASVRTEAEVGVVAVDPTSPFSGGALLGDRIRMNDLALDPGIFIRSMATRGSLGGLAVATREVLDLMDAFGFPRLLIETVGVGQTELEITAAADTVVVVLVPESGDSIQAMKAGLMEIADIFVVNKSDRPGADRLVKELNLAVHLRMGEALQDIPAHHGVDLSALGGGGEEESPPAQVHDVSSPAPPTWEIPVLKTVAQDGRGLDELMDAIRNHGNHLRDSGELETRRNARARRRIVDVFERQLLRRVWADARAGDAVDEAVSSVAEGSTTPYVVTRQILDDLFR